MNFNILKKYAKIWDSIIENQFSYIDRSARWPIWLISWLYSENPWAGLSEYMWSYWPVRPQKFLSKKSQKLAITKCPSRNSAPCYLQKFWWLVIEASPSSAHFFFSFYNNISHFVLQHISLGNYTYNPGNILVNTHCVFWHMFNNK